MSPGVILPMQRVGGLLDVLTASTDYCEQEFPEQMERGVWGFNGCYGLDLVVPTLSHIAGLRVWVSTTEFVCVACGSSLPFSVYNQVLFPALTPTPASTPILRLSRQPGFHAFRTPTSLHIPLHQGHHATRLPRHNYIIHELPRSTT